MDIALYLEGWKYNIIEIEMRREKRDNLTNLLCIILLKEAVKVHFDFC